MTKTTTTMMVLASVLFAFGCASDPAPVVVDAGASTTDTGAADVDAATVDVDAATVDVDAAMVDVDSGSVGADSGGSGEACTNAADMAVLASIDVGMVVGDCAMTTFGAEPATSNCIMMSGLSSGCTACFSATVSCTVMHCITQCIGGETPACADCRAMNCNDAFMTCAGIPA